MSEGQSRFFFSSKVCVIAEAEGETGFRGTTARSKLSRRLSALGGNHKWFIFHNSPSKVTDYDCSQGKFSVEAD